MGLGVYLASCQQIYSSLMLAGDMTMPAKIQEAMQMQVEAERKKRAAILESEGEKEAAINRAEGEKRSKILASEAKEAEQVRRTGGLWWQMRVM